MILISIRLKNMLNNKTNKIDFIRFRFRIR